MLTFAEHPTYPIKEVNALRHQLHEIDMSNVVSLHLSLKSAPKPANDLSALQPPTKAHRARRANFREALNEWVRPSAVCWLFSS
jgi:hypothetical protein